MSDDLVKRARHNALADMPHYASVELIEAMAARIEELEAKLAKAMLVEELEAKLSKSEALLAKALEVAEKSIGWLRLYGVDVHKEAATLAELKGQDE